MQLIRILTNDSGASKLVWDAGDGRSFEASAFVSRSHDASSHSAGGVVCISSQVGCNVGCRFCANWRLSKARNLTHNELVEQAIVARTHLPTLEQVSVTYSGMGEPLHNIRAIVSASNELCESHGFAYASLSTVGIPNGIRKLAEIRPSTHLFLSLHSTEDSVRRELIPSKFCFPIKEVLLEAKVYSSITNRKVNVSYLLLPGVNDTSRNATQLAELLDSKFFCVQVLLWNKIEGMDFKRSSRQEADCFVARLVELGMPAFVMESSGQDIGGGCGQLADSFSAISPRTTSK